MMYKYIATLSLFLLFSHTTSKAGLKEAFKAYDSEQYQVAFDEFRSLAEIGNKVGQYNLGHMYLEGKGVPQDFVKAYAWIKLSDEGENKEQKLLAEIRSKVKDERHYLIEQYYTGIYDQYSSDAIKKAYNPKIKDNEQKVTSLTPIEQKEATYPVRAQIEGYTGWATLDFNLSPSGYPVDILAVDSFPKDLFVAASLNAAKKWRFEPNDTQRRFKYKLDFRLEGMSNSNKRKYKELIKIKKEASKGNPSSQYLHARYGGYNLSEKTNFSPASWFYEAAQNGVLNAQYELAERLFEGNGCEVDSDKAFNWLRVSAENDFAPSQFKLAKIAYKNNEHEKAKFWLNKALKSNLSIKSIDSEVTAFKLASFIYTNDITNIEPELILKQLELVSENKIKNPVNFYSYYANVYESLGKFEEAIDYQKEAIEILEDLGEESIPQDMLEKLNYLESKTS